MGIWSSLVGKLKRAPVSANEQFRKEHKGHSLVVACNTKAGIVEHEVPLQDIWEQKASVFMMMEPGEVPIGIRCSCHAKGMYAAFPMASRELGMRMVKEMQNGKVN